MNVYCRSYTSQSWKSEWNIVKRESFYSNRPPIEAKPCKKQDEKKYSDDKTTNMRKNTQQQKLNVFGLFGARFVKCKVLFGCLQKAFLDRWQRWTCKAQIYIIKIGHRHFDCILSFPLNGHNNGKKNKNKNLFFFIRMKWNGNFEKNLQITLL